MSVLFMFYSPSISLQILYFATFFHQEETSTAAVGCSSPGGLREKSNASQPMMRKSKPKLLN
jgi:hypothetical protein